MHKRLHFADLKEAITNRDADTCLIDIRPELQYSNLHLRHSINVKPELWRNCNEDEFLQSLKELKIHLLIRFACYAYKRKNENSFRAFADQVYLHSSTFTFVFIKPNDLESTQQDVQRVYNLFDKIFDSKRKTMDFLHNEGFPDIKTLPRVELRIYQRSYEQMGEKFDPLLFRDQLPMDLDNHDRNKNSIRSIHSIVPLSVYLGDIEPYLEFVAAQAQEMPAVIYEQVRDARNYTKKWQRVSTLFYMGSEPPVVPESVRIGANCSQSFGERIVYEEVQQEKTEQPKKKRDRITAIIIPKQRKLTKKLEIDENLTQNRYTYDNGFEFTWNVAICPDISQLKVFLQSVATFMEASSNMQNPFLICQGEYSIISIIYYFLVWRRWSIRRSIRYLFKCFHDEGQPERLLEWCQSRYFVEGMDLLLREEADVLRHVWPSVSLASLLTFSLRQEPDLEQNISLYKNPSKAIERELFESIQKGNVARVKDLLTERPHLACARMSCRKRDGDDYTPLIVALRASNKDVRADSQCLELLSSPEAIMLTTLSGHDVLYYAIELGGYMVQYFLDKQCCVYRCSVKLRMNPLQRAIKFQLDPNTLVSLMNRFTVNHRDSYQRTPALYIVEEYSCKIDTKKVLLKQLVAHGADLFLEDIDKRSVLAVATTKTPELAPFIHKLISQEGTVRYPPYHSFAKSRDHINVEYFIDGENTFLAMAEVLRVAQKSVYIADWWLTAETYLDRRSDDPQDWEPSRLDNLLARLASNGVIVRVLLWDNVPQVEPLGSVHTEAYLQSLHENILVARHSSSITDGFSHHQKILIVDDYIAFVGGLDICSHRWDTQEHPIAPSKYFPGKDYFHPRYVSGSDDLSKPLVDYKELSKRNIPRESWHDITFRVDGLAAFDVCVNFVQRWNFIKESKNLPYQLLPLPSSEGVPSFPTSRSIPCKAQITRSIGRWSVGFTTREQSILNAIRNAITTSESYVYIETQFFISIQQQMESTEDPMSLSDVIVNRVRRAIREKKPFKCIVILPMFPEGNPAEDSITLRIMYWQLHTIRYIEEKILECTQGLPTGPGDYVKFYSVASCGLVEGIPYMEQIYVHAKLLITDSVSICGSANLNMRSLLGDRDSEICVVVENPKFSEALRKELWEEHLGQKYGRRLTGNFLKDFRRWDSIARKNSQAFKNFFEMSTPVGAPPTTAAFLGAEKKMRKLWTSGELDNVSAFQQLKDVIHGHLVEFPRDFLVEDVMNTDRFKHTAIDILNPLTPLHFLANIREAACITFVEHLVQ